MAREAAHKQPCGWFEVGSVGERGVNPGLIGPGGRLIGVTSRLQPARTYRNPSYAVLLCKPPIETSHPSPIEMSLRHPVVGTFEVTCDGGCDPDEQSGT